MPDSISSALHANEHSAPTQLKTSLSRHSSITRPTHASDSRSTKSDGSLISTPSHATRNRLLESSTEKGSARRHNNGAQTTSGLPPRSLPTATHLSHNLRPKNIDKSPSMNDINASVSSPKLPKSSSSLYLGAHSSSSRSISSQISPRRAGLGARTISPVEVQRLKRNNRAGAMASNDLLTNTLLPGPRKVSGIPSPVKATPLSRTRPSPVPPVPPLPDRIGHTALRRPSPYKGREPSRSATVPAVLSNPRQRSATVGVSKESTDEATVQHDTTSFTSPVKQQKKHGNAHESNSMDQQLQPANLPPMIVHGLSTPTVRRVNNMSQRLQDLHIEPRVPVDDPAQHTVETGRPVASTEDVMLPHTTTKDQRPGRNSTDSVANSAGLVKDTLEPDLSGNEPRAAKVKDGNTFFHRLSLSRSSSRSKLKSRKQSGESVDISMEKDAEPVTPEKMKRRLSLSWMKGKMSPYSTNSSSTPKIDPGTPPLIPKSFTSESISSLISNGETSSVNAPAGPTDSRSNTGTSSRSSHSTRTVKTNASHSELADAEMQKLVVSRRGAGYLARAQAQVTALASRASVVEPVGVTEIATLDCAPLNLYERGEVMDFDGKIYFTGQKNMTKIGGRLDMANSINFGYDDDRGDYLINPGDHFAYRYEIVDVLGKGSFGQVLRCIDYKTGGLVAVKVIRNKKRFHAQALVEVNILQKLRNWVWQRFDDKRFALISQDPHDQHHLIRYTDHFYFRHHLCIATDLLGMNLYEFVKSNDFKGCSVNVIRVFTEQILSCLKMLKQERVIHCDLKPENILLVNIWESRIKIIDFGSSCFEDQKVYTYIQSRFYRSPEVILGMSYGLPIDIWSMGCILAELFTGFPIFPGEDEQEQLACIMEVFGPPEKHLIENSTRKKLFFDSQGKPRSVVSSKGRRRKPSSKTLSQAIKCQDAAFLDFLTQCLRWNPKTRLTPEQALDHPFVTGRPMRVAETPLKTKKLFTNNLTNLTPRALPQVPRTPLQGPRVKTGHSSYRSSSTAVTGTQQDMTSPSKTAHRRVVSSLPIPRERVVT